MLDGRKPIYLTSIAFEAVGSFGVAISRSVPQLLVCRVVQAFGASSGLSVGVGVIGDIYKLEERGGASGIFFSVRPPACVRLHVLMNIAASGGLARCGPRTSRGRNNIPLLHLARNAIRAVWLRRILLVHDAVPAAGDQSAWCERY